MDIETKVDNIEERLRTLENNSSTVNETMKHLTKSFDDFIEKLDTREAKEKDRFNKLTNIVYLGIGGLVVFQFLVANNIIKVG